MTDLEKIKQQRDTLQMAKSKAEGMIRMYDIYIDGFLRRGLPVYPQEKARRMLRRQLRNINHQLAEINHRLVWDISLYPEQERALDAALQER